MDSEIKSVQDIVEILKRRRRQLLVPAAVILLVAIIAAFTLPRKYRSTATILIEAQEVPSEYIKANITSFADQRLQAINKRIMGTPRLIDLIKRLNLYADLRNKVSLEDVVAEMVKDIKFTTISADVIDPRSGRPAQATIAFSISYTGTTPEVAQQVTTELSSLYMEENLKEREKQSLGTSKFFQGEMEAVQASLADIEGRIAAFKKRNIQSLPELSQVNMQSYDQADRDIRQLNDQLRTLREREEFLQSQLSNVQPELAANDKEALRQLHMRLAELTSRFSERYPDVIKTRKEIAELEKRIRSASREPAVGTPDNPAYINLQSQLAGTRSEIESVRRQIADTAKRRASYQSRIFATPHVEEAYKGLMVERNNLQQKYDDLSKKSMDVRMAHSMEKEQLGERFTLVDPARLPERPYSPNVPAIILIGLALGIGSGVGWAAVREACDQSVRSADALAELTGVAVLVTVPPIITAADRGSARNRRYLATAMLAFGAVLCLVAVHYLVVDLNVLLTQIYRKSPG